MFNTDPDVRAAFITGLRQLADFLDANPDLPCPLTASASTFMPNALTTAARPRSTQSPSSSAPTSATTPPGAVTTTPDATSAMSTTASCPSPATPTGSTSPTAATKAALRPTPRPPAPENNGSARRPFLPLRTSAGTGPLPRSGPCLSASSRKDTDTVNSITPAFSRRVPTLDGARSRGIHVEFYDPDGSRYGLPTYPYHWAPKGLLTVRQLRAQGLRPGGQQPAAQIIWRKGKRVAYLY